MLVAWVTFTSVAAQEIEITTAQAKNYNKSTSKRWTSIHDPSVVYEPTSKRYYIFGSHKVGAYTSDFMNWTGANPTWRTLTSSNAANKDAFVTPAVKTVTKGGKEVSMPAFNAVNWSAKTDAEYNVDGNMWAPDVIWNPVMNKWCMYLSINGNAWHSSIILLTADNIAGPYLYQAPVVICGFDSSSHSYKDTDLEIVLGTQSSLPSRYTAYWGNRWPHTIDPAVFYDEEGKLWMVYGSWSGGIWMLELNEENGLRDYDVTYPSTNGNSDGVTSDPYYGTKIAGGHYVSGEGPYIEYINGYYYLFVSYGFYSPDGGYEMRVFRSKNPNGPYKDSQNISAIFTSGGKNYGTGNTDTRGDKLLGAYNNWGYMTVGECAQGHNSIIAAEDGRTYLIYHTKFNDGTVGHQVRTHQVFQNENGWLVVAPFEYNGEETLSSDVSTKQLVNSLDIPGTYQVMIHKYRMDYANYEEVTPVEISLNEDGTVTGAYTGTWSVKAGTSYINVKLGSFVYRGVIISEQIDGKNNPVITFSAITNTGLSVWGYKFRPDYNLAMAINNLGTMSISSGLNVKMSYDLYGMLSQSEGVTPTWTSSEPTVITNEGTYYPVGLTENTPVELAARMTAGNYYWQQVFNVTALSEENAKPYSDTWKNGIVAQYSFDDAELSNSVTPSEKASLLQNGTTAKPTVETTEPLRNGGVVHTVFGANGKESYVSMPNPLKGQGLETGATISFYVKRSDANLWDALFGMTSGTARLFMTGNLYLGYNDGVTADETNKVYNNWIDINHPEMVETTDLGTNCWHHVVITFQRSVASTTGGIIIYIDGKKHTDKYNSSYNGSTTKTKQGFTSAGYSQIVDLLTTADHIYLGNGSFWGSADARFDEVIVYNRVLSLLEIMSLNQMTNRAYKSFIETGLDELTTVSPIVNNNVVYDLMGRKVNSLKPGIYVKNGKKMVVR